MKGKTLICRLAAALMLMMMALPATAIGAEKDARARILLTRLNLTTRIAVSLDGAYTLNGIAFQRGSDVVVSSERGTLMVYYEGMALDAGQSCVFLRHEVTDGKENGFRLNDAYPLHPGDLMLSVDDGMLSAVLRAPVEEYLLGVVPYEMSDTFPIEALKAQAVAARTYVMRKMDASKPYDVVDNTNDQAYYGVTPEHKNAARAVRETRGVCGYVGNALAQCYYSASNGGQTEIASHVWGGADVPYLKMYADPYDVENPQSVVYSYALPKKLKTNDDLGALKDDVLGALSEIMESRGYDGDAASIRVIGIESAATHTAMYVDTPSKIMTKLRLNLYVTGKRPAAEDGEEEVEFSIFTSTPSPTDKPLSGDDEALKEPIAVDLKLFPTVEKALGLSINSQDNELITVRETDDAFVVESRRYGHGVGMSQRGAQWMALTYQWTYEQILRFYYPGVTFKPADVDVTLPTPLSAAFLATPGPAATPTPKPMLPVTIKSGDKVAVVSGISVNSSLNMRDAPSMQGSIVKLLYYGQNLIVLGEEGDWLHVRTDSVEGYVMSSFVTVKVAE